MLVPQLFIWWYGAGWQLMLRRAEHRMKSLADMFSVVTLLRTLFAPWRRIISYPGSGLDAHFRAMLDNFVSRCVGFVVRIFVLLAAALMFVLVLATSLIQLIAWPLLPVLAIVALVWGLM